MVLNPFPLHLGGKTLPLIPSLSSPCAPSFPSLKPTFSLNPCPSPASIPPLAFLLLVPCLSLLTPVYDSTQNPYKCPFLTRHLKGVRERPRFSETIEQKEG